MCNFKKVNTSELCKSIVYHPLMVYQAFINTFVAAGGYVRIHVVITPYLYQANPVHRLLGLPKTKTIK